MSWLSDFTGIGISPRGVKIKPKKALMTGLGVAGGGLGFAGKLGALGKLGAVGSFLGKHKDTIADVGQMGEGIYDRYQENQDRKTAEDRYRALQPLRDRAMADLMDTSRPDLSSIFADPNNPQGRYRRVGVGSGGTY